MSDKLYPATWDPKGADDCGILYCAGDEYAFGIDADAEAWWGPQLADAINDAHDLRAEVERLHEEAHWIPTADRMPEARALVLVVVLRPPQYQPQQHITLAEYIPSDEAVCAFWRSYYGGTAIAVTHWRPLPPPPEVQL